MSILIFINNLQNHISPDTREKGLKNSPTHTKVTLFLYAMHLVLYASELLEFIEFTKVLISPVFFCVEVMFAKETARRTGTG